MNISKDFLTIDEQIFFLKNNGVLFDNESKAKKILSKHSYYSIINGYNSPFLFCRNPKKYIKNVYFEEIYSLYFFDARLRTIILPYLIEVEKTIKTQVIYTFSNDKNIDGTYKRSKDDYLKVSSYDTGPDKLASIQKLISEIHQMISKHLESSDSFMHYLTNYSYIPLWVLSTQMTFGMISRFYENMTISNRMEIAKKYNLPENQFRNMLKVLTIIRNACAHGNRIYCFKHKNHLPKKFDSNKQPLLYQYTSSGIGINDLFSVILCLKVLLEKKEFKALINSINNEIECLTKKLKSINIDKILNHMGFPKNWFNNVK